MNRQERRAQARRRVPRDQMGGATVREVRRDLARAMRPAPEPPAAKDAPEREAPRGLSQRPSGLIVARPNLKVPRRELR